MAGSFLGSLNANDLQIAAGGIINRGVSRFRAERTKAVGACGEGRAGRQLSSRRVPAERGLSLGFVLTLACICLPQGVRAQEHKLRVLASFLPVYCFAANVAGDLAEVDHLLPPGADPHDFQFSPREMKKLDAAEVIVLNGLGLESWLDRVINASPGRSKVIVKAGTGLESELIENPSYLNLGESVRALADSTPNPHTWLDPQLAAHAVTNILAAFQRADPAHAGGYDRNARQYIARLGKLDAEMSEGLLPLKGRAIITYHDAFPYFARRYELRIVGVIEKVPDVEPSARYLAALASVIRQEDAKVIFAERQSSHRLPDQMGRDYHVAVATLDTLETGDFKPDAYEEGMRRNLRALTNALGPVATAGVGGSK
jgi:zinc transport system substrate-binding protein